jgi:hypothetical protein
MSASITFDEPTTASVVIGFEPTPQIELNGGESSLTIEMSGTNVFLGNPNGSDGLTWNAPSAQLVWMVPHNMGRFPLVAIRDSAGELVAADVKHLDENVLTVTFSAPVLGSVDLR